MASSINLTINFTDVDMRHAGYVEFSGICYMPDEFLAALRRDQITGLGVIQCVITEGAA